MYEITTALSTIQIVKNLTKAVMDSKVSAALREQAIESQAAIIELQTAMMNMQSQYQTLLQEKNELKQQLIDIEDWKTEAEKYSLTEMEGGIFVYALKPDNETGAPPHWLCAHCYQNKQKSILERTGADSKGIVFLCFRCQNSIRVHGTPNAPYKPPVRFNIAPKP
jgi:hypothetical protein